MDDKKKKGFLSKAWQANKTFVKYAGVFTLGIWGALFANLASAKKAAAEDAAFGEVLAEGTGSYFSGMFNNIVHDGPVALSFLFESAATFALDSVLPFLGTALSEAAHAL